MPNDVPFTTVLELLEAHGWTLARIDRPYRIFTEGDLLPIWIQVHDRKVPAVYVEKVKQLLEAQDEAP